MKSKKHAIAVIIILVNDTMLLKEGRRVVVGGGWMGLSGSGRYVCPIPNPMN